ncbi:Rrf2 family transcriptional regulator [Desulfovibrio sp. OttesenSCG-928-C06]|nr:Rrf2 family transcriptional regulator [Desulfovibrio sp. OttesenSCG-928-C06]
MKLSAKTRYAARILLDLARHDKATPVPATRLSQHTGVSVQFIEQILKPLKQAGLTQSTRGASGGHSLAKNPTDITLADVVYLMEGGIQLTLCGSEDRAVCDSKDFCATRSAWVRVSNSLNQELAAITLQDLLDDYKTTNDKTGKSELFPICKLRMVHRKGRPPRGKAVARVRRKVA